MATKLVPLQTYVHPQLMEAVERKLSKLTESQSSYVRRLVLKDLMDGGFVTADQLIEMATAGG